MKLILKTSDILQDQLIHRYNRPWPTTDIFFYQFFIVIDFKAEIKPHVLLDMRAIQQQCFIMYNMSYLFFIERFVESQY